MDASTSGLRRQHLIDPEVCIRCNTCEEACGVHAISHNGVNYVVDFDRCNFCGDCLPPCPTGAIDHYRQVLRPWTVAEQLGWESLPPDAEPRAAAARAEPPLPAEVATITAVATAAEEGHAVPPWSAAHPYINLYAPERPVTATVAGNLRLTEPGTSSEIHHIVLDLGTTALPVLEGQSVGVLPPGRDAEGKPHRVRLYSVASPREGERPGKNNIALTVKRVTEDRAGKPVRGVCSNFLCNLERGAKVELIGPYGTTFLMPNHPSAQLVMVCTGAAPMRAMTDRRRRKWVRGESAGGKLVLFFGARTPGELPYFGPLTRLPPEFIDVQFAFSRDRARPKEYVQDRMRARAGELTGLLADANAYFYLCGHKGMEGGVDAAFAAMCADAGLHWSQLKAELRRGGRYHVETY